MLSLTSTYLTITGAGVTYVGSSVSMLREAGVSEAVILVGVKAHLRVEIDLEAERRRVLVTTPGSGQAMEYQQARTEAVAALKAPTSATAEKYPMLAASIGLDVDPGTGAAAEDVLGVARAVDAASKLWLDYGAAIRAVRLSAKAAIDAADTVEAAAALLDTIPWPAPGASDAAAA